MVSARVPDLTPCEPFSPESVLLHLRARPFQANSEPFFFGTGDMTRPNHWFAAAALTLALTVSACAADDSLPTEVEVEHPIPAAPATPAPSPSSPSAPAPSGDNRRSFIWTETNGFTILPNPPGVVLVSAEGINDDGEVAGTVIMDAADGPPIYRGFKWSIRDGFKYIIGPAQWNTFVRGIDNRGNVVGYIERGSQREVFVWKESEGLLRLGVQLPYLNVLGIRSEVVFGNAQGNATNHAFRLPLGAGALELLETSSEVGGGLMDTNDSGDAVGFDGYINHGFGGTSDAVMWDKAGSRTVAYDCKGEWNCFACLTAMNSAGAAVGVITRGEMDETRVFRWSASNGLEYLEVPLAGYGIGVADIHDDGSALAHNGLQGFIFKPSGKVTVIAAPQTHRMVQPRAMNYHGHVVGMLF